VASSSCSGIAFDGSGNLFITDPTNKRISKLTGTTLTTFKSLGTSEIPSDIAIDSYKNIYVSVNHQIIKFVKGSSTNIVRYGTGTAGFLDGTSKTAKFNNPKGIAVDSKGNIFICDYSNNRIRQILPDGTVRTMAGSEVNDDIAGLGTSAAFQGPQGITLSNDEKTLYVTTAGNRIRKITICEPGFYATASGCVQCSANTYSLFSGSTICCPAGWYARPGDSQCRFDCTTTSTNFGTCDGILRTTSYYTASAVNGGSSCTLYPKNIEPCANCKTTSTDLGSCDGSLRTITFFTEAAWNGGSACTSKTVTTFTCTLDTPRDVKLEGQNPEVKVEDPIEVKVEDPIEVKVEDPIEVKVEDPIEVKVEDPIEVKVEDSGVKVENPEVKVEDPIEVKVDTSGVKVDTSGVKVDTSGVKVKGKAGRTGKVRTSQAAVSKEKIKKERAQRQ
jgi:sugar lactone lactonase YvrE